MSRDTVHPDFVEAVRRASTAVRKPILGQPNGEEPHEGTSLLGGLTHRNREHGDTYKFFLDSSHTPGCDSEKPWVKWPANVWHITKKTLLSSEYHWRNAFACAGLGPSC